MNRKGRAPSVSVHKMRVIGLAIALSLTAGQATRARPLTAWSTCDVRFAYPIIADSYCGSDPRCVAVVIEGETDAEGLVDAEVDWDDGDGFGDNVSFEAPGPGFFLNTFGHTYPSNGVRHIKLEMDDADGNKCQGELTVDISG